MTTTHQQAVDTLAIDAETVRVVTALRRRGLEPIVLKGTSFATWLYAEGEDRFYIDCDLLVAPDQRPRAEEVLAACGFEPSPMPPLPSHGQAWYRPSDGAAVDLHTAIWGAVDHELAWLELSRSTESQGLGPIDVTVLDEVGRCLQVVLHWVQHGDAVKPRADVDRALARVADGTWARAAELADRIGAGNTFVHGLLVHPVGVQLVGRLGIAPSAPPSRAHTLQITGDDTGATTIEGIIGLPGWRARAGAVRGTLLRSSEYVRAVIDHDRRRPPPTALLYLRYWLRVVRKAPGGLRSWFLVWRSLRRRRGIG